MTTTPTMSTDPTVSAPNYAGSWKWISVALAIVLTLAVVAIGTESYYLYRAFHGEGFEAPPALAPALPHPGTPILHSPTSVNDDWNLPDTLANGSPWDQMNRLHQQMDQLFNDTFSQLPPDQATMLATMSSPSLDVREEKDRYTVRADMPGADKATLKVNVEGRLLTISGQRTSVDETKDNDKVIRSERSMAQFVRSIELPGPVKTSDVDAKYDNGVLTLNLPKADEASSGTQVPVK